MVKSSRAAGLARIVVDGLQPSELKAACERSQAGSQQLEGLVQQSLVSFDSLIDWVVGLPDVEAPSGASTNTLAEHEDDTTEILLSEEDLATESSHQLSFDDADSGLAPPPPPDASKAKDKGAKTKRSPKKRRVAERHKQLTIVDAARSPDMSLLYEDVLWLFSIHDLEGALVSLERLLVLGELRGEMKDFVIRNEAKLLNLYESSVGPFGKVPVQVTDDLDSPLPKGYLAYARLANVLNMIDGKRNIQAIFEDSEYSPLEICAAIKQLERSGLVRL